MRPAIEIGKCLAATKGRTVSPLLRFIIIGPWTRLWSHRGPKAMPCWWALTAVHGRHCSVDIAVLSVRYWPFRRVWYGVLPAVRFRSKNEERESKTARKIARVKGEKERGGGGKERKETSFPSPSPLPPLLFFGSCFISRPVKTGNPVPLSLISLPVRRPVYKIRSIFSSGVGGGEGYFWEVVVGVCRPALLIFTLFQSNIYMVNVREYPSGIYVVKMNTINY